MKGVRMFTSMNELRKAGTVGLRIGSDMIVSLFDLIPQQRVDFWVRQHAQPLSVVQANLFWLQA